MSAIFSKKKPEVGDKGFIVGNRFVRANGSYGIDFIQSTGPQYINLNVTPNINWVYKLRISDVQDMSENAIFGNSWSGNGPFAMFYNSCVRYHVGGTVIDSDNVSSVSEFELEFGNAYLKVNGQLFSSGTSSGNIETNNDLYLFHCSHSKFTGERYALKCKLYYFKIEGIMDLIPRLNQNRLPCLYDKINHSYYSNNGNGIFVIS